jgi:hypothetical protein
MASDAFIQCRVTQETKAQLRVLADRQQSSQSALLKRLVEFALQGASPAIVGGPLHAPPAARDARLSVRLRPDDWLLLADRAAARGMPAATYVSVLTRAHLRHLAPLPKEELLGLKRAVSELGSVGRNLNQIAKAAHRGEEVAGPSREEVKAMLRVCVGLRDHIKGLLEANLRSWERGYGDSNAP